MPIDGYRLINPYGRELLFAADAEGAIAWANTLVDTVMDARCRGDTAGAVWVANRRTWETMSYRYRDCKRVHSALVSAMAIGTAR